MPQTSSAGPDTSTPEIYREFYEYEADTYLISNEHEESWKHRRTLVHRLLPPDADGVLLDAGCGDGALSVDVLSNSRASGAVGMDLSIRRALRGGRDVQGVTFTAGSIYDIPFADDTFPLVLCTDLLEHLDDPARAFSELVRVSSRYVLISVPYSIQIEKTLCPHCRKDYFLYGHQHSFGKEGVTEHADAAGADVAKFEHVIPMFECRRYKWFPPLKWLIWNHFKNSGTLGALLRKRPNEDPRHAS
jgi:ubiquinone/menaquinone biosynthesis C-methylase UbiE